MQFCFIKDSVTLIMPVTPSGYQWTTGKSMQTVNISKLGDVFLPGGQSRFSENFPFLLPAQEYPWMEAGAKADPQYYLDYLNAWAQDKKPVRMVITETEINTKVHIEDVTQGEQDSTGDRYITVAVREYCDLEAVEVESVYGTQNKGRTIEAVSGNTESYTIEDGDTLSVICRRFYGKSTEQYYAALAKFNGIANPHLIYAGKTLQIPPEAVLLEVSA